MLTALGTLRVHPRGFGFVDLDEPTPGGPTAAFVRAPLLGRLLDADRVRVSYQVETDPTKATATGLQLLDRERTEVFGVLEAGPGGELLLRPDPHVGHATFTVTAAAGAAAGHAALATLASRTTAAVTAGYPDPTSATALRARVLARHRVVVDYPAAVHAELAGHQAAPAALPYRRDLSDLLTFTIDADHSRDLDDALSVYPVAADGSVRVLVHIADVAAHVAPWSAVDREARRTATSLYLPGFTRPMLPPSLSEDALSLLPRLARDTLTVDLRVAADGSVSPAEIYPSQVVSAMRLNYEDAADVLAGAHPAGIPADVATALRTLDVAAAALGRARAGRGGAGGARREPELAIAVDGADQAAMVAATASNPAHQLIERLMVAANEAVASWLIARGLPGLFRVHPGPDEDTVPALRAALAQERVDVAVPDVLTPAALAALEAALVAHPAAAETVSQVLMGHTGRAGYTPAVGEHFGLASAGYLHFTSPIRRYADLMVHRIVHAYLAGDRDTTGAQEALSALAEHINTAAGVAARAEAHQRKALWMVALDRRRALAPAAAHPGVVAGTNAKGVFVALAESGVSGFLPARDLPGRGWTQTADGLALVDEAGVRLGVGAPIRVRVASADPASGQLELAPATARAARPAGQARQARPARPARGRRRAA